jgi:hypothetical protein
VVVVLREARCRSAQKHRRRHHSREQAVPQSA